MTAITFKQALAKYRPDQARDERGRFADEGGGGRGLARDPRLSLARRLGVEDLYRAALNAKGGTAKENARIKLDRELARRVMAMSPEEHASLSARDKRTVTDKITPYMTARQRRTWELAASGSDFVDASGGRESPRTTPPSFWTYRPEGAPKLDEAIAIGAIHPKSTWKEWESLSPGFRTTIVREATKQIERFASQLNEALQTDDHGATFERVMNDIRASKPNIQRLQAISSAFWGFSRPKPRSIAAGYRDIQRRMNSLNDHRRAAEAIGPNRRLAG